MIGRKGTTGESHGRGLGRIPEDVTAGEQ